MSLNDRERILMLIIERLYFMQNELTLRARLHGDGLAAVLKNHVFFGSSSSFSGGPLQIGTLVMGMTGHVGDFKIGYIHEVIDTHHCVIREIGSDRICDYSNESFIPIIGMSPMLLWEREQYAFSIKVQKAFRNLDAYMYRYGGIDFDGSSATIWVREAFGGFSRTSESIPFSVVMSYGKRTTIKAIEHALLDGGYGTRAFERKAVEVEKAGASDG
jgi:hypothetical protein